ncbi:MAG: cyclase family protein [Chloroflexi bacterium]|nr:cyclase family protein [Chloroflexota bacterium]
MAAGETRLTPTDLDGLFQQVSNWGRWGAADQRGALNYITPEVRQAAAQLVRDGGAVSAARALPTQPMPENPRPVQHFMTRAFDGQEGAIFGGVGDFFGIAPHGFATTHMDALCHIFYRGQMYNGHPISMVTSQGARASAITAAQDGVVSRGVLLDFPRLRGVDWLEPGQGISPSELEQAEAAAGVRLRTGDVLLVYTGRWRRRAALGGWNIMEQGMAGLDVECMPLLHERQIAVLGCDGVSEVFPSPVSEVSNPVHALALVAMGVHLLDNCDLEALAAACAERSRWEFLLTVAPLRLELGTASPINPIALF